MAAQIKLKKLTDIQVNGKKVVADNASPTGTEIFLKVGINALGNNEKIVFAGHDYKGTFTASGPKALDAIAGKLELCLERPDNCFVIDGVKINVHATNGAHTFTTGKDGGATIGLVFNNQGTNSNPGRAADDKLTITEKDSGWFTTGLTLNGITPTAGSSLKFGEWNDFDLPDKCHVHIDFV